MSFHDLVLRVWVEKFAVKVKMINDRKDNVNKQLSEIFLNWFLKMLQDLNWRILST
jgi:hypothetical protein